jgi:hypothetical protein
MRTLSSVAVGLLALSLCTMGCGEEPVPEVPTARLEVGTGAVFTALEEGATLELFKGCQGSQHVFVSLRAWELTSTSALVELFLERAEDGQVFAGSRLRLRFDAPAGPGEPALLEGLLVVVPDPDRGVGREVRLKASIQTDSDQSASDTRTVTLQWGPPGC